MVTIPGQFNSVGGYLFTGALKTLQAATTVSVKDGRLRDMKRLSGDLGLRMRVGKPPEAPHASIQPG